MAYASAADLQAVIPTRDLALLTDFDGDAAAAAARIAQALEDASAEIDGYIRRQVSLPLEVVPHTLAVHCRDLALWRLYRNVGHDADRLRELRAGAIAWLKEVAAGRLAIGDDDSPPLETSGGVAMTDGPPRLLTRDSLRGF